MSQLQSIPTPSNPTAGILEIDAVASVIRRRCADLGVTFEFDAHATTASTNGSHITLPAIGMPITKEKLDVLYGYVIHECGHHLRNEAFAILKAAQPPKHMCALFNITEDDGMERDRANAWNGDRQALSVMNNILLKEVAISWKPVLASGEDVGDPSPLAMLTLNQLSKGQWDDVSTVTVGEMMRSMPKNVAELTETLRQEGWVEKLRATKTPHDTWDLAVDLSNRLYPGKEKENEKIRQAGHDMSPTPRDSSSDTHEDAAKKEKKKKDKGAADEEGSVIHWKDVVLSDHNEWQKQKGQAGTVGIDWRGMLMDTKGVTLMPLSLVNVVDLGTTKSRGSSGHSKSESWKRFMPDNGASRQFANQVRRYLQAKVRSKVDRHKYHGKLDKSSIIKLMLPPIDGGDYNKRIFYEQERAEMKDTAIMVLTDWSGSMNGTKMTHAADASQRLVYVMERILKVPVALACFSNGRTRCDIGLIKDFNTRGLAAEQIARRFARFCHWTSANNDADAVHWAYCKLLKRKEERKMLIVLSDGCPAGSWKGHGATNLKFITNVIDKDPRVELYGVGIHSSAVATYYTNHRVLHDASEINNTLFQLIKAGDTHETRRF